MAAFDGDMARWERQVQAVPNIWDYIGSTDWVESFVQSAPPNTIGIELPVEGVYPQEAVFNMFYPVRACELPEDGWPGDVSLWTTFTFTGNAVRTQGSRMWVMTVPPREMVGSGWSDLLYRIGDMNQDGTIDGLDVDPFVVALLDGENLLADINGDLEVNGLDVGPFVAMIVGHGVAAIPEPSTLALLLVGIVAAGLLGPFRVESPPAVGRQGGALEHGPS